MELTPAAPAPLAIRAAAEESGIATEEFVPGEAPVAIFFDLFC